MLSKKMLQYNLKFIEKLFDTLDGNNASHWQISKVAEFRKQHKDNKALLEDLDFCFEVLAGQHKVGFTAYKVDMTHLQPIYDIELSIKEFYNTYIKTNDLSQDKIRHICVNFSLTGFGDFFVKLINREYKLGYSNKSNMLKHTSPMLAKKYEGQKLRGEITVTEKLDGNRCIASYNHNTNKWEFKSRNGKDIKVDFNTIGLDTDIIYDGEIMSKADISFNTLSGSINSHTRNKKHLKYVIFDIVNDSLPYFQRREILNYYKETLKETLKYNQDIEILETLYEGPYDKEILDKLLDYIVDEKNGEGIMINLNHRRYEQKRSDALLKYKKVQTMDMRVIDTYEGEGKYTGLVGGLICKALVGNTVYECKVGSGLTDQQRLNWTNESLIVNKIVEVAYHEVTQDRNSLGSNKYSLRFPRLKKVRNDKNDTSTY